MKRKIKTNPGQVVFWGLMALMAVALLWLLLGKGGGGGGTGTLSLMIVDGRTEEPLENCTIIVPETGFSTTTGADGRTEPFTLPVERQKPKNGMEPQQWGEVTLLIYRDGYIPYALFHTQVWEGVDRNGPKIYLFPDDGTTQGQAYSVIEGPDRAWVNALVERHDPKLTNSEGE